MNNIDPEPHGRLEAATLGGFEVRVIAICFAIAALDGFDTQSIAFVAPALQKAWATPPAQFGALFGSGLLGAMLGAILLGSLADRFGRKPLILLSTATFGVMTLLCATATSIEALGIYRLVAGLGLGGAIPNIIALVSEYAPRRVRSTVIVATFTGFPAGAIVGGIVSAGLIPRFGWESVFILGGVLPLLLVPVIVLGLPESRRYLAAARRQSDSRPVRQTVGELFSGGRGGWTILLWLLTFTTLLLAYFLVNWTPLILVGAGITHHRAIMGVVLLNLGGIIGSLLLGRISDRRHPFLALGAAFGIGAVLIATVGVMIESPVSTLLGLIFLVGMCVFGAQLNLTALSANYYPVHMRSTGIGWSMGVGRVGSFVGPVAGGALVAIGLASGQLFLCAAVPAVLACIIVAFMYFHVPVMEDDGAAG